MSDELHQRWTSPTGLDCVINPCRFSSGNYYLCGYVRLPNGHPLHGLDYNDEAPSTLDATIERIMRGPVGKRGAISVFCMAGRERANAGDLFDVHGSITYADNDAPGEPKEPGEWWYGFDCGHWDDSPDIQDSAYVKAECESLAAQLSAMQ